MKIVPVVNLESFILIKLIGYAVIYGLPIVILFVIAMVIEGMICAAVEAFLASAFCTSLVAAWNAIIAFFEGEQRSRLLGLGITIQFVFNLIAFFEAYGWIFVLVLSIIGFITTAVIIYFAVRAAIEWVVDKYHDIKYLLGR